LSSVSSFASACQLPDTRSSIANSVPRIRHAAFADVAARLADYAGQLMNHARAVAADRRNGQVLLHLWVAGVLLAIRPPEVYRERGRVATFRSKARGLRLA